MENRKRSTNILLFVLSISAALLQGCKKDLGPVYSVASLNVVNVLPNSVPLIIVQGSISPTIGKFTSIAPLPYGYSAVLTPSSGSETLYAIQSNSDTAAVTAKGGDYMFNGELNFKEGCLYSLFITGSDTTNPDFLFVQDMPPTIVDSSMGIRFVNLITGSNPMSINLEGNSNGSEVTNLSYKSISSFKPYVNNSTTVDYLFVVRDQTTGDSLTQFDFLASNSSNNGNGLTDPSSSANNGTSLTFKNITIAIYGSETSGINSPMSTMLIDNY
jgi:hypothetical protein